MPTACPLDSRGPRIGTFEVSIPTGWQLLAPGRVADPGLRVTNPVSDPGGGEACLRPLRGRTCYAGTCNPGFARRPGANGYDPSGVDRVTTPAGDPGGGEAV